MAEQDDWMARGLDAARRLRGERAGGQELPAQTPAPDPFARAAPALFPGIASANLVERPTPVARHAGLPAAVAARNAASRVLDARR